VEFQISDCSKEKNKNACLSTNHLGNLSLLTMKHENEMAPCARAEEVVAYLYGEVSGAEKRAVEQHLALCAACAAELAGFRELRGDLGLWREEILHTAPARVINAHSFLDTPAQQSEKSVWTVLALLREAFVCSPFWLRGATACASLALVGLLVFALSGARRTPTTVATVPAPLPATAAGPDTAQHAAAERDKVLAQYEKELAALKEQQTGDGQRIAELQAQLEQARAASAATTNAPEPRIVKVFVPQPSGTKRSPHSSVARASKGQTHRSPTQRTEEEQEESSLTEVMFGSKGSRLR
jgi:hypothetical protein